MNKIITRSWLLENRPPKKMPDGFSHTEKVDSPPTLLEKIKRPRATDDELNWSKEEQDAIDKFRRTRNRLTLHPFVLTYKDVQGRKFTLDVNHPAAWYAKLEEQIAQGPSNIRARMLLQRDLEKVTEHY